MITTIEIVIATQNQLIKTESENKRKFVILVNHLCKLYKIKSKIIP